MNKTSFNENDENLFNHEEKKLVNFNNFSSDLSSNEKKDNSKENVAILKSDRYEDYDSIEKRI